MTNTTQLMQTHLEYVVDQIKAQDPLHSKKVKKNLAETDAAFQKRANDFLERYVTLLQKEGKTLDYGISCYLQMIADVNYETVQFMKTGEYTSKSFDEVNKRVYNNPEVMEYYMHGLLMSQFLWTHHYGILLAFNTIIEEHKKNISNYLEVGGGHGLYISEAIGIIGSKANYDLADISPSSLDIAKKMIRNDKVNYILTDIFEYFPQKKYDFITMGEVLEHVEDPVKLLQKLHTLVSDDGRVFITTPTNAPAIDHIYLFRNAGDIRKVISDAGFKVVKELCIYSEKMPPEIAEKNNISMMYAGLLAKK